MGQQGMMILEPIIVKGEDELELIDLQKVAGKLCYHCGQELDCLPSGLGYRVSQNRTQSLDQLRYVVVPSGQI